MTTLSRVYFPRSSKYRDPNFPFDLHLFLTHDSVSPFHESLKRGGMRVILRNRLPELLLETFSRVCFSNFLLPWSRSSHVYTTRTDLFSPTLELTLREISDIILPRRNSDHISPVKRGHYGQSNNRCQTGLFNVYPKIGPWNEKSSVELSHFTIE